MEIMRRLVMTMVAALLFLPVLMKSRAGQEVPARAAFRALSSSGVLVKVSGDVRYPGVYEVAANSMAVTAINLAQPVRPLQPALSGPADRLLSNGSAVAVTRLSDGSSRISVSRMTVSECLVLGIPLDISTMNEADFDRLPGIGPALARRIIEYRQKNGGTLRVSDLAAVEGIGEKKYGKLLPYFQVP